MTLATAMRRPPMVLTLMYAPGSWPVTVALDMGAPRGTAIRTALSGRSYLVRYPITGYGYHIMIDHDGGFVTLYGHCSKLLVTEGQRVNAGDVIAEVGSTGRSTGNHLHFEVRINGEKQNPGNYRIQNILRNITYVGIMRSGETVSDIFPSLQIITQEQFERVEKSKAQRTNEYYARCHLEYEQPVTLDDASEVMVSRPPKNVPRKILEMPFCQEMSFAVTVVAAFLHPQRGKAITQ